MAYVDIIFDIERQIENQVGLEPLPFPSMDKSGAAVCEFHLKGICERGNSCPLRHTVGDQTVVCKHWLRGLCKKGDKCEFLHVYDMSKMPECFFYSKFNACTNKECTFLHIDPGSKRKDCPWYDRGFCRHGPNCRHKHTKRVMCPNYLAGFCPQGPQCRHVHPKQQSNEQQQQMQQQQMQHHHQQQQLHHQQQQQQHQIPTIQPQHHNQIPIIQQQQVMPNDQQIAIPHFPYTPRHPHEQQFMDPANKQFQPKNVGYQFIRKPLSQVVCYKCGAVGHYANRCLLRKNVAFY